MLPCARSCIGKKVNKLPAACAEPRTNEPLLFLYPEWFQNEVRHANNVKSAQIRKLSTLRERRGHAEAVATKAKEHVVSSIDTNSRRRTTDTTVGYSPSFPAPDLNRRKHSRSSLPAPWTIDRVRPFDKHAKDISRKQERESPGETPLTYIGVGDKRNDYNPQSIDVFELSKTLASFPPMIQENLDTVLIDAPFLEWLTGTSEENIWKHHDGSGCIVHVNQPSKQEDTKRRVVFTGTSRAREIAKQHLKHVRRNYHEPGLHELPSGDEKTSRQPSSPPVRVDQLPPPKIWNLKSFCEFVKTVIGSQAPRGIERILYPKEESFNKTVAKVLMDLFAHPGLRPFQSSFALRHALEFCSTRTDIAFAARSIWASARQAGIVPDTGCFNFEISRCFRVGNATGINRRVREMRASHIYPNAATWACLFRSLKNKESQSRFLQLPAIRSATHDQFSKEMMVQALVATGFKPSDKESNGVFTFQRSMHGAFGDGWLTPSVVQSMIEQCTEARAVRTVSKILTLAASLNVKLDMESLTSLLEAVTKTDCFKDILLLLKIQPLHNNPLFSQKQVELAFREAWKQRLPNSCRVLWHYAASHGLIRHSMMAKVSNELTQNVHPSTGLHSRVTAWIAAIVVGTDRSIHIPPTLDNNKDTVLDAILSLSQWAPSGEARHNQMQLAHALLEQDMTAWQRVQPMNYEVLMDLMDKAFALDMSWQEQDMMSNTPLSDLVRQAIHIRLRSIQTEPTTRESDIRTPSTTTDFGSSGPSPRDPSATNSVSQCPSGTPIEDYNDHTPAEDSRESHAANFQKLHSIYPFVKVPMAASTLSLAITGVPSIDLLLHYLRLGRKDG